MKLKEKHLVKLGFNRTDVSIEESGDNRPYHFYTFDLSDQNSNFCLITCASDEVKNDEWWAEILDTEFRFTDYNYLNNFIKIIQQIKKQKHEIY